jgi:hypothetical protein
MEKRRKGFLQTPQGLGLVFAGMVYFLLSMLWFSRPDVIGGAFHRLRMIESIGTWSLWSGGWDQIFADAGTYRPTMTDMAAASLPFGLIFTVLTGVIAAIALVRVNMDHISSLVASSKPKRWRQVMEAQSHRHPANRFFLDYNLASMPLDKGPARLPEKALELLERTGSIAELLDAPIGNTAPGMHAGPDILLRTERVGEVLADVLGQPNPFLATGDIAEAVAALPWPAAILIRTGLERVAARDADGSAEDFSATVAAVALRMDDVWRRLNALKAKRGQGLVIGLDGATEEERDADRRRIATALKLRPDAIVTLADLAAATDLARDDRAWLSEHLAAGGAHARLVDLLRRNHYLSGCLATVLVETRTAGIYPPESFRWLRFIDYPLWCFLRTVAAPACTPIAAGAHAHWLAERQAERPLVEPQFTEALRALRQEARKFLTGETLRRLRSQLGAER